MDLATFWDCHRRAFAHFGGCRAAIVYDRTKTVVKRHVAPGVAVPLHPEAAAFAEHYGFTIDVLAAYRPTGKGRVERQVSIVRDHVIAGRTFDSIAELDGAFEAWLPIRRAQVHRTHGQVIGVRAEADRAALLAAAGAAVSGHRQAPASGREGLPGLLRGQLLLRPGPPDPGRATGPAPSRRAKPSPSVPLGADGAGWLATHPRARERGTWVVDPAHWDGLPDGHTRAVVIDQPTRPAPRTRQPVSGSSRCPRCWPGATPTSTSRPGP